jgi:YVTN family beta-propeller protein
VSRFDKTTGQVLATIPTGGMPYGLTFDGRYIWTTEQNPGVLVKIDPSTNQVVFTESVNESAGGLLYCDGSIWVASLTHFSQPAGAGTLKRINPADGTVIAEIPIGLFPLGVTSFGGYLWIGNRNSNTISKVDPTTNTVVDTISSIHPFEIVDDGKYLWASNRTSGTVSKIDPSTDQVIDVIPTGEALGMAFDGRSVWVAGFSTGNVTRIDPVADKVTGVVSLGSRPHADAWDGSYLWVSQFDNSNINKIYVGH